MTETRKLAAILAADVVGFSRLAGADEDRTLARLRALRSDLIDPTIAVHDGRVVKRTGDEQPPACSVLALTPSKLFFRHSAPGATSPLKHMNGLHRLLIGRRRLPYFHPAFRRHLLRRVDRCREQLQPSRRFRRSESLGSFVPKAGHCDIGRTFLETERLEHVRVVRASER
jgi:hypothetical protein